jgi:hypothetical protein
MPSLAQEVVISERFRIVECADQESVSIAARRVDCSRTTVYELHKASGEGGCWPWPIAPATNPIRTPVSVEAGVLLWPAPTRPASLPSSRRSR